MVKRIAVVGPESTGKSELCQQLARDFETEWVPEYARVHLDRLEREYKEGDLLEIAKGQLIWEEDKYEYSRKYLFCDTTLLVIKIWSDHKYGRTDPWIEEKLRSHKYDYYLVNDIDLPWRADPYREHPNLRKHFLEKYKDYLNENSLPYSLVSGIEGERLQSGKDAIASFENSLV